MEMKIVEIFNLKKYYLAFLMKKKIIINWIYTRKTHFSKMSQFISPKKKQQNLFFSKSLQQPHEDQGTMGL